MEALFIYIAKSSGLVVLFYCAYLFLLRKETFFNSNRWFLLSGLFTSLLLPLLVYTKIIWFDPSPIQAVDYAPTFIPQTIEQKHFEMNWNYVLVAIYALGLVLFLVKFAMDFYSLRSVLKSKKIQQQADFKFIDTHENIAPFSYFDYIVYNSSMYTTAELESIIEHEKVHSEQNHTLDVLISRAFCVLFWFNPIAWLYKKAITQNLEFIADKEAAQKITDKRVYQYTLLKITTHENCIAITNHFYQSLIKKRIIMLNKNQSKKRNCWKYAVVAPALVGFVLLFQVEVIAKERVLVTKAISKRLTKELNASTEVYKIKKNTTDQELKVMAETLKLNHNVETVVSDLKRNSEGELIRFKLIMTNGSGEAKTIQISGNEAIKDCEIIITTDENGIQNISVVTNGKMENCKTLPVLSTEEKNIKNSNSNNDVQTNHNVDTDNNSSVVTNTTVNTAINTNENTVQTKTKKIGFSKQIIVVNGNVLSSDVNISDIDPNKISSITIVEGANAYAKYGNIGNNSVIEVVTKSATVKNDSQPTQIKVTNRATNSWTVGYGANAPSNTVKIIKDDKSVDYKKALIVIDGKISDYSDLDKIIPEDIRSVSNLVSKNQPEETRKQALEKYGEKAQNGVIVIQTKEYFDKKHNSSKQ